MNSSRLFRDKDKRYKHNFHVAVSLNRHLCDKFANFGLILKIYRTTVVRLSHDSRATFVRVSHDFPANVTYFYLNSYDSRATFVRMSLSYIFTPDSREVFARLSRDCLATLA